MIILVTNRIITDVDFFTLDDNLQQLPNLVSHVYMSIIEENERTKAREKNDLDDDDDDEDDDDDDDDTNRPILHGYDARKILIKHLNRGIIFDLAWIRQAIEHGIKSIRQGILGRILSNAMMYEIHQCPHEHHLTHGRIIKCKKLAIIDEFCARHTCNSNNTR